MSTPAPEDKYAAADAAKAEAADHEMTLEDLEKMSTENAILLGTCQTYKYQTENGKAAMDRWTEEFVNDVASASSASEVVSIQVAMIKEGYSCTFQEMVQVSASGTLEEYERTSLGDARPPAPLPNPPRPRRGQDAPCASLTRGIRRQ